ncbi:MAG: leucine-rich repeat protein, partial [Clostridiales bacterium]|nr:leucine-rich repeat protein [Clostridiales bacterium]
KAENTAVTWTCEEWDGVDTPAGDSITITATDEPTTEEPTTEEPTTEEPTTEETREQTSPDGYLTYIVENNEAEIIYSNGTISGAYAIPDTLGGYPVTSITGFNSQKFLTSLYIPSTVTLIGMEAFQHCTALESIDFSDCVSLTIGYWAFSGCTSLKRIDIPDGVTRICYDAFSGCTSLERITISDNVSSIAGAFYGTAYYNDESNWEDGVLYIGNHLISADESLSGNYEVKEGTKTIAGGAFAYCTSLTGVTIPDSVTYIYFDKDFQDPWSQSALGYWNWELLDGFTIYGYTGSAAETYANKAGITFVSLGEYTSNDEPAVTEDPTIEFNEESNQVTVSPETSAETFAEFANVGNVQVVSADGEELTADDLIGTGCKVQTLDENGNVVSEYTVIVPSDVDGNGKITAADARLALRMAAQLDTLEGVYAVAADFDADTAIKPSDARSILRVAAKLD